MVLAWQMSKRASTGHAQRSTGTTSGCFDSACVTRRETESA